MTVEDKKQLEVLLEDIKKSLDAHNDSVVEKVHTAIDDKIDQIGLDLKMWMNEESEKREAIEKKLDDYIKLTKPMVEFFGDVTSSKKILFWILGILGTLGAFYLMIREIFFK